MKKKTLKKARVLVLRTAGTNCDEETAYAFAHFGAKADLVHINQLYKKEVDLLDYHILALPGGFTYGDDIESGRILANELRFKLGESLCNFCVQKKLIIGICNGFQVLVKAGILPGALTKEEYNNCAKITQKVTLSFNNSGKFEDRWTYLKPEGNSIWLKGLEGSIYFPVAHAEGKFIAGNEDTLKKIAQHGQIALRYVSTNGRKPLYPENPNGSMVDIAGITDRTGRILGLMPHPERHFLFEHHPRWTRMKKKSKYGDGAKIFENGVRYVEKHLL